MFDIVTVLSILLVCYTLFTLGRVYENIRETREFLNQMENKMREKH